VTDRSIYLASRSPRRQELLRQIGVDFELLRLRSAPGRHLDVVEETRDGEPPLHYGYNANYDPGQCRDVALMLRDQGFPAY